MLTVKTLKEFLSVFPPEYDNFPVIMPVDQEGNGYNKARGVEVAAYVPDGEGVGQCPRLDSTAENNCLEEDEWENIKKNNKCLVIYP